MKMNLKKKIIALAVLPALILGIASIVIALTTVKDSLIDEIQDSLQGTAAAALAAYDQNSGEYMMAENGDVWKGSYNISKSENAILYSPFRINYCNNNIPNNIKIFI